MNEASENPRIGERAKVLGWVLNPRGAWDVYWKCQRGTLMTFLGQCHPISLRFGALTSVLDDDSAWWNFSSGFGVSQIR